MWTITCHLIIEKDKNYVHVMGMFQPNFEQLFFFLSNDLHILQTACMANKNRTQNTIWKTKQHKHWTLCAIVKSNKVIKTKKCRNWFILSIPIIHQAA